MFSRSKAAGRNGPCHIVLERDLENERPKTNKSTSPGIIRVKAEFLAEFLNLVGGEFEPRLLLHHGRARMACKTQSKRGLFYIELIVNAIVIPFW